MSISTWILLFFLYAFLGWICEVIFVSVGKRRFVNRGFLYGPLCPIYGVGALVMIFIFQWIQQPVLLFLVSMVLLSTLEYITSVLLEKLFHLRLWDYSNRRFQLHGRICLRNSLLFGVMSLVVCYVVQPWLMNILHFFPLSDIRTAVAILLFVTAIDLFLTLASLLSVRQKVSHLMTVLSAHPPLHDEVLELKDTVTQKIGHLRQEGGEEWQALMERLRRRSSALRRIMDAYPNMQARVEGATDALREMLPIARQRQDALILSHVKVQPRIRYNDKGEPLFGQSASYSRYFAVFFVGCVLGFLGEEIFCLIQNGVLQSRQGMLYGPFNQIYGMGLVIMVAFLDALPTRRNIIIFLSCAVLGGAFEYFCSYFQELIFGTVSWDYTGTFLSIGGRTNFNFMLIWGLAGVLTLRFVMPPLSWFIESIPPVAGRRVTRVLTALLLVDALLTIPAVYYYTARQRGDYYASALARFFNRHYPDSLMKAIFPNMRVGPD